MSFSDDWQHCYQSGCPAGQLNCTENKELKYESLVTALAYIQYCSVLIAIVLYLVTIAHIVLVDKLNKILHIIEVNICLALLVNQSSEELPSTFEISFFPPSLTTCPSCLDTCCPPANSLPMLYPTTDRTRSKTPFSKCVKSCRRFSWGRTLRPSAGFCFQISLFKFGLLR